MYAWALKVFIPISLAAPRRAHLEMYKKIKRGSDPTPCFPPTWFQLNKLGFDRMKYLYELLPTVPWHSTWSCSFPMEKISFAPSLKTSLSALGPSGLQWTSLPSPQSQLSQIHHCEILQQHLLLTKATQVKNNYLYFCKLQLGNAYSGLMAAKIPQR